MLNVEDLFVKIDYNHSQNIHSHEGPRIALEEIFSGSKPQSILDVGCGIGTWLKAAADFGISDFIGVDGVDIPAEQLLFPPNCFRLQDLTKPWDLGRKFEVALCLEVAEHLDEVHSETLIDSLVRHADTILFSAACPDQIGQYHVNCQWPVYWQQLFNKRSFVCEDGLRWQMWDDSRIEPWYRQNLFLARKAPDAAGHEPRIQSVVHPGILNDIKNASRPVAPVVVSMEDYVRQIEQGIMPISWYLQIAMRGLLAKAKRRSRNE